MDNGQGAGIMNNIKIAPSILSADFACLRDQIEEAEKAGADYIHVDVMDGHFVPNLTIGPLVVKAIKECTNLPLDVHLMIDNPELFLDDFVNAGSDLLAVHVEACPHLHRLIQNIRSYDIKAGVALNPATPLYCLDDIVSEIDFVVIMSVNPGFGGQKFIPQAIDKVRNLRRMIDARELSVDIELDGGVTEENAAEVAEAGASILVAGSAVFCNKEGITTAIKRIKEQALLA